VLRFATAKIPLAWLGSICAVGLLTSRLVAQTAPPAAVLTHHNDVARTGVNSGERVLTRASLGTLHRSGGFKVDGQVYAQPLFVPGVVINGTPRNVLYIATMRNYVYAYDADAPDPDHATPLWKVGPPQIGDPVPYNFRHLMWDSLGANVHDSFGITSTPVIDPTSGALWLVAKVLRRPSEVGPPQIITKHLLHKLSIVDGHPLHDPVNITATIPGSGDHSQGGQLTFDPDLHLQRAALLLSQGSIYVAFGSHQDTPGFHGWLFRYGADDLAFQNVLCTTPDGKEAGIWQAGSGPAADPSGNLYVMTGNGTYDVKPGRHDYGMAFVKFAPDLRVLSSLAPSRSLFGSRWFLNLVDADLGSSGPVLVSDTLVVGGGKPGRMYLVESSTSGTKLDADPQVTKKFGPPFLAFPPLGFYHIHGLPVVWHASSGTYVFVWPEKTPLTYLTVASSGGGMKLTPCPKGNQVCRSQMEAPPHSMPGGMLTLSSNGSDDTTAVLWASLPKHDDAFIHDVAGVLYAFNPADLRTPLWSNANQVPDYGFAKYCPPTVTNGRVYLATFSGTVDVYDR